MYLIPQDQLEKGDIILTRNDSLVSKVVRKATSSGFSHAMLYVGHSSYIHSDRDGVHAGNLQRLMFEDASNVMVLRVNCDDEAINKACDFARAKVGTSYSKKSAVNAKVQLSKNENLNRQFCSRLVAQAFEFADTQLVANASFCTPQELMDSESTNLVSVTARLANQSEIDFANTYNPLEKQTEITNEILTKVRKLSGQDIQTLEQVTQYVIANPKHDKAITAIYKDSGYLSLWQYEISKNSWRYDGAIFLNLPLSKDELKERAQFELESAEEQLVTYKSNLVQYCYIEEVYSREYSAMLINLYDKLIDNTLDRIVAAEYVLEKIP
ncbi:MAG: hypothetical protein HWD84_07515 [Flavobacteriaceae bacterium]|nr:hypothetical protein [Flavobacteriaceae bacterium]